MDDNGFKFKVGELVQTVVSARVPLLKRYPRDDEDFAQVQVLQVVERATQECPGGVQRHYTVRPHAVDAVTSGSWTFLTKLVSVNEIEVVAYEIPDA